MTADQWDDDPPDVDDWDPSEWSADAGAPSTGWEPEDLAGVLSGDYEEPEPAVLEFHDSPGALLYPGNVNGIIGPPAEGKTWVAQHAAKQQLVAGCHVMWIDLESNAVETVNRLRALDVPDDTIAARFDYYAPDTPPGALTMVNLLARIEDHGHTLVVIDSVGEALGLSGADPNKDADVTPWMTRFPKPLAQAGPAVVLIDHTTKVGDTKRGAAGSGRKQAVIQGSEWSVHALRTPTRTTPGRLALTCTKDRHGTYQRGSTPAHLTIEPGHDRVHVRLWHQDTAADPEDLEQRMIAQALVGWLRDLGRAATKNEIENAGAVKASAGKIRGALDLAEAEGAVTVTKGARNSHLYAYEHDLEVGK